MVKRSIFCAWFQRALRGAPVLALVLPLTVAFSQPRSVPNSPLRPSPGFVVGRVNEATDGKPVPHAIVRCLESSSGTETDSSGYFRLGIGRRTAVTLSIMHVAFQAVERRVAVNDSLDRAIKIGLVPRTFRVDEVVISSARASSPADALPLPTEAIDPALLPAAEMPTPADALQSIAGVSLSRDGMYATGVAIRGMSRSNIVMLIDQTRIETATDIAGPMSLVDMNNVERVEVTKGVVSSLQGTGAVGGIVQFITKRPMLSTTTRYAGELSLEGATVNWAQMAHGAVELSSPTVGLRFSLSGRKAHDVRTPSGTLRDSRFDDFHASLSTLLSTFEDQTLSLSAERSQGNDVGIAGGSSFAATASARYTLIRRDLLSASYQIGGLWGSALQTTLRGSWQQIVRNVEVIQSSTLRLTPHATHTTASGQIESRLFLSPKSILTGGVEYWQRSLDSRRERYNSATSTITGERPLPLATFGNAGVFGQFDGSALDDRLHILAGGRYDWISIHNDPVYTPEYVSVAGVPTPTKQTLLWNSADAHNHSWSLSAGAVGKLLDNVALRMNIGSAFRSPSLEERYQYLDLGSVVKVGNPYLKPERSYSIDGGISSMCCGLTVSGDVFYTRVNNLVSFVPGTFEGRAAYIADNVGRARYYGWEARVERDITPVVHPSLSGGYVRGEDTENHLDLPQIPPIHATVLLDFLRGRAVSFSYSATAIASQHRVAPGEMKTGGYVVHGISLSTAPSAQGPFTCTVQAGIDNIFNRAYRTHLSTIRGVLTDEPGRNVFLSLKAGW